MAWVLIDDEFYDHPKWRTAPGDSIALWVAAIAWCNRSEQWEGRIPTNKLAGLVNIRNSRRTIVDLEVRQAMHRDGDSHVVHDFAEWQRVEKKKAISEARRAAGKKGATGRWNGPDANGKPDGNGDGKPDGNSHARERLGITRNRHENRRENAQENALDSDPVDNDVPGPLPAGMPDRPPPEHGKQDGNSHTSNDGLLPTTYHLVPVSDNSTPENTPEGVENSRRAHALDHYAAIALDIAKAQGVDVRSDESYKRKARTTGANMPDLDRWLAMFPTAPASAVGAWMHGDKHSMGYYPRADTDTDADLATVHHLPGAS